MRIRLTLLSCVLFLLPFLARAQSFYELENIQVIELEFAESNWQDLLAQYHAAGNGERLLATAVINGVTFDSVGVRYKGNSSYNVPSEKKPFNIKLDYVLNQDYQGFTSIKLNNGFKDPTLCRETLGYWLLSHFMEASHANYARVYINGNYFGLYTSVESVNKSFAERRFESDKDNPFFKGDAEPAPPPPSCPPAQPGATLNYLGDEQACYETHYQIESDTGWNQLIQLCYAVDADHSLVPMRMEVDRFLWMSVFNNLTVNLDSYLGSITHNYYLFRRDNGRFVPVIWDLNECFGGFNQLSSGMPLSISEMQQLSPDANKDLSGKPLLELLLNDQRYRKMYYAHYRAMLEHFFANGAYLAKAEELQTLISQAVQDDPNALYSFSDFEDNLYQSINITGPGGNPFSIVGLQELMDARTDYLQNSPEWQVTAPNLGNFQPSAYAAMPGEQLWINIETQEADSCWLLYRYNSTEDFSMLPMYDDGNHQDGAAGDGIFGVFVNMGSTGLQFAFYAENAEAGTFLPYNATFAYYELGIASDIAINELMASNATTQADQDGEFDDWVELYNNTSQLVSLEGYHLSDDESNLQKWTFPAGAQIEAQGYLIVWLDKDETQQGLHANFKLSADGEALFLSDPAGNLLDGVQFGAQLTDYAYARCPNGSGSFGILSPTFQASNETACLTDTREAGEEKAWQFYPNPVSGSLYWQAPRGVQYPLKIRLSDLQGKCRLEQTLNAPEGSLSVQNLPTGMYLLFIEGEKAPVKLVVSKP